MSVEKGHERGTIIKLITAQIGNLRIFGLFTAGLQSAVTDGSKNTSEFDSTRPRFFFIIIHALEWISRNPLRLYDMVTYTILPTESIFHIFNIISHCVSILTTP